MEEAYQSVGSVFASQLLHKKHDLQFNLSDSYQDDTMEGNSDIHHEDQNLS